MSKSWEISRRAVLRGLGASIALPWLEVMAPAVARAALRGEKPPVRMAFLYIPNGVHMDAWTPSAVGSAFDLPETLKPLAPFQDDLLVLSGLAQKTAFAMGDGPGDHARSLACFLTGVHPKKTNGADIKVGVSVDQIAAQRLGAATRLPSIEIGCDRGAQSGNCDSGYSCAYSSNISWRTESTPMPKEVNPRLVFDRLFSRPGGPAGSNAERDPRSILDMVSEDAQQLQSRLGGSDRKKMDEYLTSIRELELRINRAEKPSDGAPADYPKPLGTPRDYPEHVRLMLDLLALAFQADVTRIATFVYANEGSTRSYRFIGIPDGHHDLSHHGGDPEKHEKIKRINLFHIEHFAALLAKLKATREGDGTLLDNTMIVYGSGIGDGNRHNHDDLPILLAGKGGGTIATGRHLRFERKTPLNNLYLSMLDRVGAPVETLGDSTGRLQELDGSG